MGLPGEPEDEGLDAPDEPDDPEGMGGEVEPPLDWGWGI